MFIQKCGGERKAKDAVVAGLELEGGSMTEKVCGIATPVHVTRNQHDSEEQAYPTVTQVFCECLFHIELNWASLSCGPICSTLSLLVKCWQ